MDTGEGMCYGEHCELCKTDESQTCTPEPNNTLCVNFLKVWQWNKTLQKTKL